jgi:hypothetical protein
MFYLACVCGEGKGVGVEYIEYLGGVQAAA